MSHSILHLRSSSGFYGAERMIVTVLQALPTQQMEPRLAVIENYINGNTELYDQAIQVGIQTDTLYCRSKWDWQTLFGLKKLVSQYNIELIHSHDYKSHVFGLLVAKYLKLPIVSTLHGWTAHTLRVRIYEQLERILASRFDYVICVSPSMVKQLKRGSLNANNIKVVPNSVDTKRFTPDNTGLGYRHWGFKEEVYVFGNVARFTKEKGHMNLLVGFATIAREFPKARLLFVGDGPERSVAEEYVTNSGLIEQVVFAGQQDHVERILIDIDCYVSPSLTEGAPLSILEAMASSLPIIATNVGSVGEMLEGGAGMLVPPGDVPAMRDAMRALILNKVDSSAMRETARARCQNLYGVETQAEQYANVYSSVLGDE